MTKRRVLAVVLVVTVLAAAVGWFAGRGLKSSNEAQSDVAAPEPSLITVPVESVSLESSLVVRGSVRFEGSTNVVVSGGLGPAVITGVPPERGEVVDEGDVFVEVTGRPVFVLAGELPMFRSLGPGSEGDDVLQFEQALARIGYDPGNVDGVFDEALEQTIAVWYSDAGYSASGPTLDQQTQLSVAQSDVLNARSGLRASEQNLAEARRPVAESTRLQLDLSVRESQRTLNDLTAERDKALVDTTMARDAAVVARDAAVAAESVAADRLAQAVGGTHPDTGLAPTDDELSVLMADDEAAKTAVVDAEAAVVAAEAAVVSAGTDFVRPLEDATSNLAINTAVRRETLTGQDTSSLVEAVNDAGRGVATAEKRLDDLETEIGIEMPEAELVFLPTLPRRVESVLVERGDIVSGALATVSGVDLILDSSVPLGDRPLIGVGDRIVADDVDLGVQVEGEVVFIADDTGTLGAASNRYYLRIRLDEGADASELPANMRVTIPFSTSGGDVLAVPLAAVSAAADGTPRVQVERADGTVDVIDVITGLRAGGLLEVRAIDGDLAEGDRVVVGFDGPSFADDEDDETGDESSAAQ